MEAKQGSVIPSPAKLRNESLRHRPRHYDIQLMPLPQEHLDWQNNPIQPMAVDHTRGSHASSDTGSIGMRLPCRVLRNIAKHSLQKLRASTGSLAKDSAFLLSPTNCMKAKSRSSPTRGRGSRLLKTQAFHGRPWLKVHRYRQRFSCIVGLRLPLLPALHSRSRRLPREHVLQAAVQASKNEPTSDLTLTGPQHPVSLSPTLKYRRQISLGSESGMECRRWQVAVEV